MRISLKWAGVTAAAVTLSLALGACTPGSSSTKDAGSGSITLNGDRSDFVAAYKIAGDALSKVGGSTIDPRNVPSTENYQQVIRSSLQTNSTTDLVKWWNGYRLQDLARSGGLEDLTTQWNDAVQKGWVSPETKDSFSYDGKVYGLPLYKSYWVMFYNKKVFDKVGIKPPTTWAEFMSNNDKIKTAGVAPLFSTQEAGWTSFIWFEEILSKLDPDFYAKLMKGDAKYTDPTAQKAMAIWSDMSAKGYFTPADTAWDSEPSLFQKGTVAQVPMGTWRNGTFTSNGMTSQDYGAYVLPMVDPGAKQSVIVESGVISVAAKAPHKDQALKTMDEWLNPDVQTPWVNKIKDTSANPKVITDDPTLKSVTDQVANTKPTELNRYWEASPPALIEGGVQILASFMVNPSQSNIAPTLDKLQSLADSEWAKWKAGK
ncbi:ABC transporter substrate-binding protein [Arthrobacter sp. B2a2-09]|uniref:ABC transporter substrate-binding protein n=1 Tax=Arthrobacter sp. B2a2-09 TaxID=2952822 RepID=UPI0022CD5837|nr:extracellular solute-binding protein [Arthrobacter sp. B2a2-09]MCZ9883664.1 extracellular solute-binding protein [Arthrobacter sp. B2a2-09]